MTERERAARRNPAAKYYATRRDGARRELDRLEARIRRVSNARFLSFLLAAAALVWAELRGPEERIIPLVTAGAAGAAFVALVVRHGRLKRQERRAAALWRAYDLAEKRVLRRWDELPPAPPGPAGDHPYAADLDLFGRASLFQLVDPAGTPIGRATMRTWLLEPAAPAEVAARQEAVAELASHSEFRDELSVRQEPLSGAHEADVESMLRWAEGEPWLHRRPWLLSAARLVPAVNLALIVLHETLGTPLGWIALPVAFGWLLTIRYGRWVGGAFARAFSRDRALREYSGLLELLAGTPFRSPLLSRLRQELEADGVSAHQWMRRLERLMGFADVRHTGLAYLPLQSLVLWDFHVLDRLERWQAAVGRRVRGWLAVAGEFEALAALGRLAYENPDWAFPEIADDRPPVLRAAALAHPLLPDDARVANDVEIGPPGTFLLVTGSNMSGKSTLLRAIGANVVLAQAGGPVCATSLRMPPVVLQTCMRVQDSLEQGLSRFMAELMRLKGVVEAARAADGGGERVLLYLLDEILQGTNTAERQIAARRILQHLLASHAIGAVTTHDLTLADTPELQAAARPVHFQETVHAGGTEPVMTFDYRLRPGLARSTNALRLMEIVGLG